MIFMKSPTNPKTLLAGILTLLSICLTVAEPMGTVFTYQGRLSENGTPANGTYEMTFALFDDANEGTQVGAALTNSVVPVNNGFFAIELDFGDGAFNGEARWLQIEVRSNGLAVPFTPLTPRQALTPTPYALQAQTASTATSVVATGITGMIADSLLSTNIARLDGSANFSGAITASQFVGSGAGLTNLSDIVHPADLSAPAWSFDRTYTYRANEGPWDYARDGFILLTASPYSMDFTNALVLTNGYVTIFPKDDPGSPTGKTNWPPFYLVVTNSKPLQSIEADMVVTTNGATINNGLFVRGLVLLLADGHVIGTGGTNYTLANMHSIHVSFSSAGSDGVIVDARVYTNGVNREYREEVPYGRPGVLLFSVPSGNYFRPGDTVKCRIGFANDDTLRIQVGSFSFNWRLELFRLMHTNCYEGWLESYDQHQTNFNTTMSFSGIRYAVNQAQTLLPGIEQVYTNPITSGVGQTLSPASVANAAVQFYNPVRFTNDARPTYNGVGLATTNDVTSGGLTTNITVSFSDGRSNTLYFTNGILRRIQ